MSIDKDGVLHLPLPSFRHNAEIACLKSEISQLKLTLATMINWIALSAASPLSRDEAVKLLDMIAVFDKE